MFHGCITETQIPMDKKSVLTTAVSVDVDGDKVPDIETYSYSPIEVSGPAEGQSLVIDRKIFVYPDEFEVEPVNAYNPEIIQTFQNVYKRIGDAIEEQEKDCRKSFNFATCLDAVSCKKSCNADACIEDKGYDVGLILKDFKDVVEKRDKALSAFANSIVAIKTSNSTVDASIALTKVYLYNKVIENHPAVTELGLCKPSYGDGIYEGAFNYIGKLNIDTNAVLVLYKIIGVNIKGVEQVYVQDSVPFTISTQITKVVLSRDHKMVSKYPLVIEFAEQRLSDIVTSTLAYKVITTMQNSRTYFESWTGGDVSVKVLTIQSKELNALMEFMYNAVYLPLYNATGLPYLAFSVVFGIFLFLILFIKGLFVYLYNFWKVYGSHKNWQLAFKKAFGESDIYFSRNAVYSAVLIVIALLAEFLLSQKLPLESFDVFVVKDAMQSDVFMPVSFILYLAGFYFMYFVVADKVKGLIVGKEYYKNVLEYSPKANKILLRKLEEKVNEAKRLLDRLSGTGVDVSKEFDYILGLPVDELNAKLYKEDPAFLHQRIEYHLTRVNEIIEKIKAKSEIAEQSWPRWESYIKSELEGKKTVSVDVLIAIPYQWRIWAVKKYIELHPEEGLSLEGQTIKREVLKPEEKVRKVIEYLSTHYDVPGGFVYYNGKTNGYFKFGKKSVVEAVFYRLIASIKEISKKPVKLIAKGQFYVAEVIPIGKSILFIMASKEDLEKVEGYINSKLKKIV